MKPNSDWVLLRICSLQNFTRSYQSVDSFNDCLLKDKLLDMTQPNQKESFMQWCGQDKARRINNWKSDLNQS